MSERPRLCPVGTQLHRAIDDRAEGAFDGLAAHTGCAVCDVVVQAVMFEHYAGRHVVWSRYYGDGSPGTVERQGTDLAVEREHPPTTDAGAAS